MCAAWDRLPSPTTSIASQGIVGPPAGYTQFCATHTEDCPRLSEAPNLATGRDGNTSSSASADYWRKLFGRPNESLPRGPGAVRLELNSDVWAALNFVNHRVNETVRFDSTEAYRLRADWRLSLSDRSDNSGNCKDIVVEKRHELIALGYSREAFSVATVRTRLGQAHAVLVAHTDRGDYILDSATSWISDWRKLDYEWVALETSASPTRWAAIEKPKG